MEMGVKTRFFDLGRHIQEISSTTFAQFEAQSVPYPAPYLQHAWLGLLFWDPDTPDIPLLWFIKLPLDEQGKLVPSERDQFLKQLLIALGANIEASKQGQQIAAVLEGNPYVFTPSPERQASIHAKVNKLLGMPTSDFYQPTVKYIEGDLSAWQEIAIQGLADVAVRWPEHQGALARAIKTMPARPLNSLCLCLEHEAVNGPVTKAIYQRLENERAGADSELIAGLIRAMSQSLAIELRHKALTHILNNTDIIAIEILAAIATRCHLDLCSPDICLVFLEALSRHGQDNFNRLLADVLFCAPIRPHILTAFRAPQRSQRLAAAIGGLLNPMKYESTQIH